MGHVRVAAGEQQHARFLAVADGDDALAFRVPGQVADVARERLDLELERVLQLRRVPDPDRAGGI